MVANINVNRMREFIKLTEACGHEFLFKFRETSILVEGVDGSNVMFIKATMHVIPDFEGEFGVDTEMFTKLLPKGIDAVQIAFGRETTITGTGYSAKMRAINEVDLAKIPKIEFPIPAEGYALSPQMVYDRLKSLQTAFGKDGFEVRTSAKNPGVVYFSDSDDIAGNMDTTVFTTSPILGDFTGWYSYDHAMAALNAIRLMSDSFTMKFMPMPKSTAAALVIQGSSESKDVPNIDFQYVIAPRLQQG
jgi:hypothetical protein